MATNAAAPASIRLVRVAIPLIRAHGAAHGIESLREVILIEWTDNDGSAGWGECSTLSGSGYVTETTDEAWRALVGTIGPRALLEGLSSEVETRSAAPGANAGIRDASLDSFLRGREMSLSSYLGGGHDPLQRCAVIAAVGQSAELIAKRAAEVVEAGALMVKVKIAPGHDLEVLSAVIDAVDPVPVAADANGAYSRGEELWWINELSLAYVEQPFSPMLTPAQLGEAASLVSAPVALDESITSRSDMVMLAEAGAGSIVSIKPLRLGGIESAVDTGRAARELGLEVFVGGMLETGVGRAGALAVASALNGPIPTDLGPSSNYFAVDVCEPIECDRHGLISAPFGVGLGRTPTPELLERFTVSEVQLRV